MELEEFQASSRDYEVELETQLKQYETSDRELRSLLGRAQSENDSLQVRSQLRLPIFESFCSLLLSHQIGRFVGINLHRYSPSTTKSLCP